MPAPATQQQLSPQQLNGIAAQLIKANALPMKQQILTTTFDPRLNPVLNIVPRNVGLILGYWLEMTATLVNDSGATFTVTPFGPANLISRLVYNDLNNNVRINTAGWHLNAVDTAKSRRPYGSALVKGTGEDSPIGYGSNYDVISVKVAGANVTTIANGETATIKMLYYVPMSYSDDDLRGAVYSNVVNATQNLQLTINNNFVAATGTDGTLSGFTSAGAASLITSVTVICTQSYLDQLPQGNGAPLLPLLDLAHNYELKDTNFPQPTVNQDFTMQYSNFREFLSTIAVYYNGTALVAGTDINYWALRSANLTNIFQITARLAALFTRQIIGCDMPLGTTYFPSRRKPVSTINYGNMELVLNASTAGAGAYVLVGYEDFSVTNTVATAGSLAGNA